MEAFERRENVALQLWEANLIFRLDDAVLATMASGNPGRPGSPEPTNEIPLDDTQGVRALFAGIAESKRRQG